MRIGIVNDIEMALEILSDLVETKTSHTVAWTAKDGIEAVENCGEDTPDLVLMDLIMPLMEGVEATRLIMKKSPCAILVVTSSVVGNMAKVYEAMGHGALDVVKTPALDLHGDSGQAEDFLKKLDVIEKLIGEKASKKRVPPSKPPASGAIKEKEALPELLLLGASTGGPMAVVAILEKMPAEVPFATVVVQHVDQEFAPGLAHWLNGQTKLTVELALQNAPLLPGHVYLAAQNRYLLMDDTGRLFYRDLPEAGAYRPSIDLFFSSVAKYWPKKGVAALLTGMGVDGAQGLKQLHDLGWQTIAEDRSTCVVFGMPKVAIGLEAASEVLPLDAISDAVIKRFSKRGVYG